MTARGNSRVLSATTRDRVVRKVADRTGVAARDMLSRTRTADVFAARAEAMRALRAMGYSFPEIGRAFGRDHSTVIHAVRVARS